MKFKHKYEYRKEIFDETQIIENYLYYESLYASGYLEEINSKIDALSDVLTQIFIRLSDSTKTELANELGFIPAKGE